MFTMNMASFGMLKGGGLLSRVPGCGSSDATSIKEFTCEFSQVALVEAAGIAPASQIPQVVSLHDTCVEQGCQWLHYVCTEEALSELVAAWHGMAPEDRDAIVRIRAARKISRVLGSS